MKLFAVVMLAAALTGGKKADFSGTYRMNKEKTNLGPAPEWILPRFIKVEQKDNQSIIARTALNRSLEEQTPVADTLAFDGTAFTRHSGTNISVNTLNWNNDSIFTVVRKTQNEFGIVTGTTTELWLLEDNGKVLVVNRSVEQANGMKYTTRAVFDKQ